MQTVAWDNFKQWLQSQYSATHASNMYNYATKYKDALVNAQQTAQLKALANDKRRHTMQALSALSKYLGYYEQWQAMQKQVGLHWQKQSAVSVVKAILSQEANTAYDWLKQVALAKLPNEYKPAMIYTAISGLRPSESCNSINLIIELNSQGKLDEYYDRELCMLQHYKWPDLFLRQTKNCYISFVNPAVIETLCKARPFTYNAVEAALERYNCLPIQTYGLRKYYGTLVKKSLDREMVDLLQGRLDPSVFVKHYYRPLLLDLSSKVLAAIKPLESELLPLVANCKSL